MASAAAYWTLSLSLFCVGELGYSLEEVSISNICSTIKGALDAAPDGFVHRFVVVALFSVLFQTDFVAGALLAGS